ncbi:hypothetical protein JHK82_055760 [Glycine max]|nr:hypothetical protein JHK82_055760 [Glycine max]
MSFLEEFHANIKRQNEQRCEQEIEDIKRGVRSGNITPDTSAIRFSDEALDEQKHSIRVADEKVALAVQAYDLVDTNIQQLDQYLKKFDEEIRRGTAIPTFLCNSLNQNAALLQAPTKKCDPGTQLRPLQPAVMPHTHTRLTAHRTQPVATTHGDDEHSANGGDEHGANDGDDPHAVNIAIQLNGGRKTRQTTMVTEAQATSNPTGMDLELPVDPNEPTYCFCNQVSYGAMVACDNPNCSACSASFAMYTFSLRGEGAATIVES